MLKNLKNDHKEMFIQCSIRAIAISSKIVKVWKQPKYSLKCAQINKMWNIQRMKYYSVFKKKKNATTWDLEDIMMMK